MQTILQSPTELTENIYKLVLLDYREIINGRTKGQYVTKNIQKRRKRYRTNSENKIFKMYHLKH